MKPFYNKNKAKTKTTKRSKPALPEGRTKPTKHHYNRFVKNYRGWLVTQTTESHCSLLASVVEAARNQQTFESHYTKELALVYGLKHKLIRIGSKQIYASNGAQYHKIYFTKAGIEANRVCVPNGLRYRWLNYETFLRTR